ncbi:PIN domain-containing protein [Nostoc sp. FACHB-973]|nr:PIN domain-containing protein [Nostoc sp. FACHB-973]
MEKVYALLDSCVLFPFYLRDTLLCVADAGLYLPFWSQEILDGATRNLVSTGKMTVGEVMRLKENLKKYFPEAMVEVPDEMSEWMTNHEGDRHVLAAAVKAGSDVIVTSNLKHFESKDLAPWNIQAQSPDEFLSQLYNLYPEQIVEVLQQQSRRLKNPPMTVANLLDLLSKKDGANLTNFTNLVRCHESRY